MNEHYRTNIAEWRAIASDADIHAGRDWYPIARSIAADYARTYRVPLDVAAGIIAVLSPSTEWLLNVQAAESLLRAYRDGTGIPGPGACETTYYTNVLKAWNIVQSGSRFPRCGGTRTNARGRVVKCHPTRDDCPARAHLHGPKVCEFHDTILGKLDGRVVDVWATRAADVSPYDLYLLPKDDVRRRGEPGSRFRELQEAYRDVSISIGEDPSVTQAIVWTTIRRSWRNSSATQTTIDIPF